MLYIISTPIGNLKDITFRAIETFKKCLYILCEDTRVSRVLLNRYDIKTKLISYHKFNEKKSLEKIIKDLKEGADIGLISDAGTPLLSDPGFLLIEECYKKDIEVTAIPGACSVIDALVLSGFDTKKFQFLGFLKKKETELLFEIKKMLFFEGTSIFFESARRVKKTIEKIARFAPDRRVVILKEMTKKFEKRICLKAEDLAKYLSKNELKGEIVILVENGDFLIDDITIVESVELLQKCHNVTLKEAIKISAKLKKISKKEVYNLFKND